ncbi:MAG: hypothetical protein KJO21_13600 [Verrucomicrobiae bacterium]|nr:hypothetical protein [Verrucomicrobiae bacterium]NNJ44353.1 hypothetical protein [Akkermansiaceae bacterium]
MIRHLVILILCLSLSPQLLVARTFTNIKGQKIEATVQSVEAHQVKLLLDQNGKSYHVPLTSLSPADREYIQAWHETSKKGRDADTQAAAKQNFDAPWPKLVSIDIDIEIEIVEESKESKRFVYHSPNYAFICDVGLSKNVVKKFAVLFEATRDYCRLLPISSMKAHVPGAQFRHKILLFESKSAYVQNGGPPSSAGVFISRGGKGVIMAPLTSLGLKKVGSSYMYDYKGSNETLPHELTHQLTDNAYFQVGARGWFSEGLAEYVASTPYRSGKFMVRSNLSAIKAYATGYGKKGKGGRALGTAFNAPNLKDYMLQPYNQFTANANFNYGLGMLLTYYFFHMEDDRSNITSFLKALKEGKKGEVALQVLLNGRSWDELEKQITKAWRSRGVRITFQ